MSKTPQSGKSKTRSRAFDRRTLSISDIAGAIGSALVVGLAIYSDNLIVSVFVVVFLIVPGIKRIVRSRSKIPLREQGTGTSDNYAIVNGVVEIKNGTTVWSKPLLEYEGVLRREETTNFSKASRNYTRQIIELRHGKNRDFDVNLYTSLEDVGVRARWEEAAQKYNLPTLRDLGDGEILRREPEDVGKSLRELADEGSLNVSFSIDTPTPPGTKWTLDDSVLTVDQKREPWRSFMMTVPFLLFYMLVGYNLPLGFLFGSNDPTLLPVFRAIVFLPAVLVGGLWTLIFVQIQISTRKVTVTGRLGRVPLWRNALALEDVGEVLVDPSLVVWHSVLIESISNTLRVWPLNEASAQWLAQFLRSAIATAPDETESGSGSASADRHE